MLSVEEFGVALTMIVFIGFYLPLGIYYIWTLYKKTYRNKSVDDNATAFLQQRYTSLSLISAVAYCIQFIDLTIWCMAYTNWYHQYHHVMISGASITHIIAQFLITQILVLRFWLIHYRMKFEMISQNDEWKKIINPDYQKQEHEDHDHAIHKSMYDIMNKAQNRMDDTQWILQHKSSFGSHRWCFKRLIVLFSVIVVVILIAELINYDIITMPLSWIGVVLSSMIYFIFAILWSILLFLHCRSPQFSDSIYIKKELGLILQTMMLFLLMYIIFIAVFGLGLSNSDVYQSSYFTEVIVLFHAIAFSNMVMLYVLIFYPLKKSKQFTKHNKHNQHFDRENSVRSPSSQKNKQFTFQPAAAQLATVSSLNKQHDRHQNKIIKLDDVLKNVYGFNLFMKHLSSEFSMENLLSITEFLQFKRYVHTHSMHSKMNKDMRYWLSMIPLEMLPKSKIVYWHEIQMQHQDRPKTKRLLSLSKSVSISTSQTPENKEEDACDGLHDNEDMEFLKTVKLSAYELYMKYIKTGCDFEVNISYELRLNFTNTMDNKNKWLADEEWNDLIKLRDIFDDCCAIMRRLITHSFSRFRNKDAFEKIKKEIKQN